MIGDFLNQIRAANHRERGQILILLALAMIGLLVAAGLAVDSGVLFMRKSQLDRAVDAAALAGVTQLPNETDLAKALQASNTRGQQLLAANGIVTTSAAECPATDDPVFWQTHDYCGRRMPGAIPGSIRYHVEVRWQAEVYFMGLLGFDTLPLRASATAEYMPMVDIFASDSSEYGILQSSNAAIFGPQSCTGFGDAYTPTASPYYAELEGVYTYRIRIPREYIYNEDGSINHESVRIELFDPDTRNTSTNTMPVYTLDGTSSSRTCSGADGQRTNPCIHNTRTSDNPFWWFVRIDENRSPRTGSSGGGSGCATPGSYTANYNTRTEFRLYYLEQLSDGSLREVDLAYYIGESDGTDATEAQTTDLMWVSPGAPASERMPAYTFDDIFGDGNSNVFSPAEPETYPEACAECVGDGNFTVKLVGCGHEVPGIYTDPATGVRDIFLDVRGFSGSSENGYELWAGPPRTDDPDDYEYTAPSYVNARQIYLELERADEEPVHLSEGIAIYGIGHLPMNSNIANYVDIPLAYLGPEFAGQQIRIDVFDPDSGTEPPIAFYFDTIPKSDWIACFDDGTLNNNDCNMARIGGKKQDWLGPANLPTNNGWVTYEFSIPGETPEGQGIPFYGGRLIVIYRGGNHDTYGWKMSIEGRPFLVR